MELYNDDCIKVMNDLIQQKRKVDLIIVDPPYKLTTRGNGGGAGGMLKNTLVNKGKVFNENNIDIIDWLPLIYNLLNDKGHCYIMTNNKNIYHYLNTINTMYFNNDKKQKFHFVKNLIWVKDNKILNQSYMSQFEYIIMLRKGGFKPINNCGCSDVIFAKNKKTKDENNKVIHITEKPLALLETLVSNSSQENDIVLDFAMGIGSTGVACKHLNRDFIGIEIDTYYFDIASKRIKEN